MLRPIEKEILTSTLTKICAIQKSYGLGDAELENLIDGFIWAIELSRFPFNCWMAALGEWVLRNNEIPRPSDIVNHIDPLPQPLSAAHYVALQKRSYSGIYLDQEERGFCEAFRKQENAKVRGGSEVIREAEREFKQFQIAYDAG